MPKKEHKSTTKSQSVTRLKDLQPKSDPEQDQKFKRFHQLYEDSKLRLERQT